MSETSRSHSVKNKVGRILWGTVWLLLYRPSPRFAHGWRRFLLRLFGAKIGPAAHPYPSAIIWAPWNLEMGEQSCLGDHTDCYCVDRITIGPHSTVSQYSFLCTASHDYEQVGFPLITAPITIGGQSWIAADVFVGPGVTIGTGAVIGARSTVLHNVADWTVVVGNPGREVKRRSRRT
jgi:putative colanic acid biosynthesis acetyltransferase WcaF